MIVAYIDAFKPTSWVEPICRVLRDHDLSIARSTYYTHLKQRLRCAKSLSDERLLPPIMVVHAFNLKWSPRRCCRP